MGRSWFLALAIALRLGLAAAAAPAAALDDARLLASTVSPFDRLCAHADSGPWVAAAVESLPDPARIGVTTLGASRDPADQGSGWGTIALTSLGGAFLGTALGIVAGGTISGEFEYGDELSDGALIGGYVGQIIGSAAGAHIGNGRRGSFGSALFGAGLGGLAGAGLAVVEPALGYASLPLQVVLATSGEMRSAERKAHERGAGATGQAPAP